jgi:hypothetical protein
MNIFLEHIKILLSKEIEIHFCEIIKTCYRDTMIGINNKVFIRKHEGYL